MKDGLRKLSDGTELALVLIIAFGAMIPANLASLLSPENLGRGTSPPITDGNLQGLVLYELIILAILGAFLRMRNWSLGRLGLRPTLRETVSGIGLCLGYLLFYWIVMASLASLWPAFGRLAAATHLVGADLRWPSVLAVSVINPVFEEVFVCGYVITVLKDRVGLTTAINVSAGVRVFYHLYQGVLGVVGVVPFALLFAYSFARTGRLWPLIVAHALTDFVGLATYITSR